MSALSNRMSLHNVLPRRFAGVAATRGSPHQGLGLLTVCSQETLWGCLQECPLLVVILILAVLGVLHQGPYWRDQPGYDLLVAPPRVEQLA